MSVNARIATSASSAGLRLKGYPSVRGTLGAATSSTATLAGAAAVNSVYVGAFLTVTSADGALAQTRNVSAYVGGTTVATVVPDWDEPAPDNTYTYAVYGLSGVAQAGSAATITLAAAASAADGAYAGALIRLNSGAGSVQVSRITAYAGATRVATVSPAWAAALLPESGTVYSIYGEGGSSAAFGDLWLQPSALQLDAAEYADMYVDILACPGRPGASGQVRKITSVVGGHLNVERAWDPLPRGSTTYRIIPGWSSNYVPMGDNSFALSQIVALAGQSGVRETYTSITATGSNIYGVPVSHREAVSWGTRYDVDTPGVTADSNPVIGAYYRVDLICFGSGLDGGIGTRFCDSSQTASAQSDSSASSTTIGSGGGAGELPALGQAVMAESLPMAIASNQTAFGVKLQSGSGTGITSTGTALDINIAAGSISAAAATYTAYYTPSSQEPGVLISAGATELHIVTVSNTHPTLPRYVKLYDVGTAPSSASTPILALQVTAQSTEHIQVHLTLSNGLGIRTTTGPADADTGNPGASDVIACVSWA